MDNRPVGREKRVTGQGSVQRRGSGLRTGPVGNGGRPSSSQRSASGGSGGPQRSGGSGPQRSGGGKSPIALIIGLVVALIGGGGGAFALLSGGSDSASDTSGQAASSYTSSQDTSAVSSSSGSSSATSLLSSLLGSGSLSLGGGQSSSWERTANTGSLDTEVASGARDKRTVIKGNGQDTVTILVYMCGTDLESKSGMATSDLQEMTKATLSDQVNLIVYTGGCSKWQNSAVSSSVNQIYQVKDGGLIRLKENAGTGAMTDPSTLVSFIEYGTSNFPADRTDLILWDHGGGSLSGYGYDEKNASSGSMTLSVLQKALKTAGKTFDFIGFDACLMATVETGLMLDDYADYMVASEETEPGIGWYYTDWLTKLSANTSMPTTEIGKNIIDSFTEACAEKNCQKTTLSLTDLAELSAVVPSALSDFAKDTSALIQKDGYQQVSSARNGAREFASSSKIDQIDLVNFADSLETEAGKSLSEAILGAVKYNRTGTGMTNAYGLSIYFPYQKVSKVDTAVSAYENIGMDDDYARCIQQFASMEVGGQAAAGGSAAASPLTQLLGGSQTTGTTGSDAISQLFSGLLGGDLNISGLTGSTSFLSGRSLDMDQAAEYIADHQFDPTNLVWTEGSDGRKVLTLPEDQWSYVNDIALSVYYDDGEGFVDLGLDNAVTYTDAGELVGETDGTWLAINGQTVAYYYESTTQDGESYTITGRVPALLNGERVNLRLVFTDEDPYGHIEGAVPVYEEAVTDTVAKTFLELEEGDTLDFLCDYYSYEGDYLDSYYLGDSMTVTSDMEISNVELDAEAMSSMYRVTDIYGQTYWTEVF